jgi:hypothetical protein
MAKSIYNKEITWQYQKRKPQKVVETNAEPMM